MGKTIHSQGRNIILKVLKFFEEEKSNKRMSYPVDQVIKRTCAATGISKRTVMNIKNEVKMLQQPPSSPGTASPDVTAQSTIPILSTPGKKRKHYAKKGHLLDPVQNAETTEQNLEDISLKHSVNYDEQSQESRALNAQALKITLARIQENPQLYIGIPKNCYHIVDLLHKQTKIPTTHILLCLKKVKLDTHFEELADQFGIPSEEAKDIFVENIPVIAKTLQSFIANLYSKNIKSNLLIPFRRHHNTTTVIDTLELKVQPTTAQSKELTQSENGNTIKYLISCCPDGFVDYVSPGYGGRQTDENLLESTGYLERFIPGTCIITKRFKNAEPMLLRKGMKLLRPRSYLHLHTPTSPRADQYAPYKRILDDHIERVVQRVREFTMIKDNTAISSDLVRVLDEAVVISCALINLQSFVIN